MTNREYKRFVDATGHPVPHIDEDWDRLISRSDPDQGIYMHLDGGWAQPYNWSQFTRTYPPDKANHPVVLVSWHDARAYCNWLSEKTGKPYRLPIEEEWEKAARGTDGREWPWGNSWDSGKCNSSESRVGGTTPVDRYPGGASPYGVMDMAGNVWEWTSSRWSDPELSRVVRGGSWSNSRSYARCAYRLRFNPDLRDLNFGFRVAASPNSPLPLNSGF